MLKVKLVIEDTGDPTRNIDLGEVEITRITLDASRMSDDYLWRIAGKKSDKTSINACGFLVDNTNGSALDLLYDVLSEWKSGRQLPIDNHGFQTPPEGVHLSAEEIWKKIDARNKSKA